MGGFFGAVAKRDVTLDIFFGVDYHSHLGTRRGGMIIHDATDGFQRQIHSIENTPFRTQFEKALHDFHACRVGFRKKLAADGKAPELCLMLPGTEEFMNLLEQLAARLPIFII